MTHLENTWHKGAVSAKAFIDTVDRNGYLELTYDEDLLESLDLKRVADSALIYLTDRGYYPSDPSGLDFVGWPRPDHEGQYRVRYGFQALGFEELV